MDGPTVDDGTVKAAPAPLAADVGIVAALSIEIGFLVDRLQRVRRYAGPSLEVIEGEHAGKIVAVVVGGTGRQAARVATTLILEGHQPSWVLSAGFAGALNPALLRNDVVFPNEIVDSDGHRFSVDGSVEFPGASPGRRVLPGRLLTVDHLVRSASEKTSLHQRFKADLVDMETEAVAALCTERKVRFLSIRVVSDEATAELPSEVAGLMNQKGARLAGSALRAIWNRPSSLRDFWSLHAGAQEAADRLADVTLAAIGQLPS